VYTVNACNGSPLTASKTLTVSPNANAGTISGTSPLCVDATAQYSSNGDGGGSWTSSNTSVATVNASTGVVSAVAAGTTNITYTVNSGCNSPLSASKTLTVSTDPLPGTVSGTSPLCIGQTATYTSNGTSGGKLEQFEYISCYSEFNNRSGDCNSSRHNEHYLHNQCL
jgi:uncharacterized protein YjdB